MARPATKHQNHGNHEAEMCYNEESESPLQYMVQCDKNPKHENFIPIDKFEINHLPPDYRDSDIFNLFIALGHITVRLMVRFTSPDRPKTYPETGAEFPFSDLGGRDCVRKGSGWVWKVCRHQSEGNEFCPCKECKGSDVHDRNNIGSYDSQEQDILTQESWENLDSTHQDLCQRSEMSSACAEERDECSLSHGEESKNCYPHKEWAEIEIVTAAHLVFDETEAQRTTCLLFDDNSCDRNGMVKIGGFSVVVIDIDRDLCIIKFVTHDMNLVNAVEDKWAKYIELCEKVWDKYNNSNGNCLNFQSDDPLCVVVSHPHGASKQITIGTLVKRQHVRFCKAELDDGKVVDGELTQFTYSAPTCPGSSGAPVMLLSKNWWWWRRRLSKKWTWGSGRWVFCHPHTTGFPGLNKSAIHWEPTHPLQRKSKKGQKVTMRNINKRLAPSLERISKRRKNLSGDCHKEDSQQGVCLSSSEEQEEEENGEVPLPRKSYTGNA